MTALKLMRPKYGPADLYDVDDEHNKAAIAAGHLTPVRAVSQRDLENGRVDLEDVAAGHVVVNDELAKANENEAPRVWNDASDIYAQRDENAREVDNSRTVNEDHRRIVNAMIERDGFKKSGDGRLLVKGSTFDLMSPDLREVFKQMGGKVAFSRTDLSSGKVDISVLRDLGCVID